MTGIKLFNGQKKTTLSLSEQYLECESSLHIKSKIKDIKIVIDIKDLIKFKDKHSESWKSIHYTSTPTKYFENLMKKSLIVWSNESKFLCGMSPDWSPTRMRINAEYFDVSLCTKQTACGDTMSTFARR